MHSLLSIGAVVDKKSVDAIGALILKILATSAGDAVKEKAIVVVAESLKVENVNLHNCILTGK